MSWKYEKEFRADHPETVGETDKEFDLDNYKDWLEQKLEKLFSMHFVSGSFSFANYINGWYEYSDNTEDGDVYNNVVTGKLMTERQIYSEWLQKA